MRRCAVDNCTNSDLTVLCHRFPKSRNLAQIWQCNLNLNHFPLDILMSKFTVCYMHFNSSEYRNSASNSLNSNAIPQLQPPNPRKYSPKNKKVEKVQLDTKSPPYLSDMTNEQIAGSPVNFSDSIELLHEDTDDATEIEENFIGTPCGSDDICILPEEQNAADDLIQSIDGAGFTMLDAASCTLMNESKTFEVSENSTDLKLCSDSDSGHSHDFRPDSTDSDVEVLVSESIFESQWSETDCSAIVLKAGPTITTESPVSPCVSCNTDILTKTNDEFFDSEYGLLDRKQLIDIIKEQAEKIQQLDEKLESYKLAHQTLAVHFEAFHKIICDGDKT